MTAAEDPSTALRPSRAPDTATAEASGATASVVSGPLEEVRAAASGSPGRGFEPERRARALVEALPYIQRFQDAVVVVKYGGSAMTDGSLAASFARDVALLRSVGLKPVVVHGGGPQIGVLLRRLGKSSEFRDGLRVTDADTLDVVRMVLVGKVGRDIVGALTACGAAAVGMTGEDGGLITAVQRDSSLGFVGDVAAVNPAILQRLLDERVVPVVAPIGADGDGQAFNINADTVAGALAAALAAEKVVYLTDVAGLLRDPEDESSLVARITVDALESMLAAKELAGGMIPKAAGCVEALRGGARGAHILDGRVRSVLLLELFTDTGMGTMVVDGCDRGSAA